MRKYGVEHFHIELIEQTDEPEEREKYWIEFYGSFKNGYNATIGGDGKKYLDYNLIIKTYNELHNCRKVAQILNVSPDSVRNILNQHGYHLDNSIANSKPVAQLDLKTGEIIAIYPSARAAESALNIAKHVNAVCTGKRKSAGGYGWKHI